MQGVWSESSKGLEGGQGEEEKEEEEGECKEFMISFLRLHTVPKGKTAPDWKMKSIANQEAS